MRHSSNNEVETGFKTFTIDIFLLPSADRHSVFYFILRNNILILPFSMNYTAHAWFISIKSYDKLLRNSRLIQTPHRSKKLLSIQTIRRVEYIPWISLLVAMVMRACDGGYSDFDCYGHDVDVISEATVPDCMKACDEDPRCESFHFNTGFCHLKEKACANHELSLAIGEHHYFKFSGRCGKHHDC